MKDSVASIGEYLLIYVALMALLALTLWLSSVDLRGWNGAAGLVIAALKAALVVVYFMHANRSSGLHRVFALVGVFWLGILLCLSLSDYLSRDWLALPGHWPQWITHRP